MISVVIMTWQGIWNEIVIKKRTIKNTEKRLEI